VSAPGPSPFSLTVAEQAGRVVVTLTGELDLATAPQAEAAVLPAVSAGRDVVLDLRDLEFMDSTGVRVLIAAQRAAAEGGGTFALRRTDPASVVTRILEVSGLIGVLTVVDEG
jgi:anti-sigma B factor antagonist